MLDMLVALQCRRQATRAGLAGTGIGLQMVKVIA